MKSGGHRGRTSIVGSYLKSLYKNTVSYPIFGENIYIAHYKYLREAVGLKIYALFLEYYIQNTIQQARLVPGSEMALDTSSITEGLVSTMIGDGKCW